MGKEINVIFLDDDHGTLGILQKIFAQEPYGVLATANPDKAFEALQKQKIKVVVSDQVMSQVQGIEFLQEVRNFNPNIVRILLTGYSDFSAAERAINLAGVFRIISKPWEASDILNTIHLALEQYDAAIKAERASESLKTTYEMRTEFASTVSHELRTPLASIKTAIDLVYKKILGPINFDQEEVLGRAKKNVDRLKRLIDDILDLNKMESGKLNMHYAMHDITQVAREVVEIQKDFAKTRGLYIKTSFDNVPNINFDSDRIIQILNNLLSNAIKFTKQGGVTIKVVNKAKEGYVLISVIDTGKGISEENLSKLFEKFYQVESIEENEEGGTGLGLAICKEIVLKHGGAIWAESELGRGTVFNFTLPISISDRKINA